MEGGMIAALRASQRSQVCYLCTLVPWPWAGTLVVVWQCMFGTPELGIQGRLVHFVPRTVGAVGAFSASQRACIKSATCCDALALPAVLHFAFHGYICVFKLVKWAGYALGAAPLLKEQQNLWAVDLNRQKGERTGGSESLTVIQKENINLLTCNAMPVPSAPTASQAMSQIFMYVIVPLSSIVAKETQILLLTCGELLTHWSDEEQRYPSQPY